MERNESSGSNFRQEAKVDESQEEEEVRQKLRQTVGELPEQEWATSWAFQHLQEYPGRLRVERKKQEYLKMLRGGEPVEKILSRVE